ncbi:MAG: DUF2235 domain-containing protein [Burkholderiales bacterium]|nr:DUF2235 domain-containing protein [Burkholderiales bacterium]
MKRIVICSDGTWQSPESENPTHLMRLARGIAPAGAGGARQVVYYDWGVGTEGDSISGGATGAGLDKNIMDCYRFIVHNYAPGDALFFFGFSRGAYTVRSLAGFIRNCGILKRAHAEKIPGAYELYRERSANSVPDAPKSKQFRRDHAVADISPIEFIGVWDTVGALGIPAPFLGTLNTGRYLFHDTQPSKIIRHARHAVAIDERREDFLPSLWEAKEGIDLRQVWFAGVHTDIGGGYEDHALGDFAGQWMTREASGFGLAFERHFLASLKPDHRAAMHNEYKGMYKILGRSKYRTVEPLLHRSVKKRFDDAAVAYNSPALKQLLQERDWDDIELVD